MDGRKGLELVKVTRRDQRHFDGGIWLHEAPEVPKEQFKREAEKELTGKVTEPSEIIYFKLHKSQIPVVEQAMETTAMMPGTAKSCTYSLEMSFATPVNISEGGEVVFYLCNRMFACQRNCKPCARSGRLHPHHLTLARESNRVDNPGSLDSHSEAHRAMSWNF